MTLQGNRASRAVRFFFFWVPEGLENRAPGVRHHPDERRDTPASARAPLSALFPPALRRLISTAGAPRCAQPAFAADGPLPLVFWLPARSTQARELLGSVSP